LTKGYGFAAAFIYGIIYSRLAKGCQMKADLVAGRLLKINPLSHSLAKAPECRQALSRGGARVNRTFSTID
jgi:hypothetical protein